MLSGSLDTKRRDKGKQNASGGYIGVRLDKLRVAKIKLKDKNSTQVTLRKAENKVYKIKIA